MEAAMAWFHRFETISVIPKYAEDPVEATPVMFMGFPSDEQVGYGLVFDWPDDEKFERENFFYQGRMYLSTLVGPHDMFSFWRAAQLVRWFTEVDDGLVQLHIFDFVYRKRKISEGNRKWLNERYPGLDQEVERVMQLPIPQWLVDKVLERWSEPHAKTYPWTITDEVRAGTLQWDERFASIGVITPAEEDRQSALWETILPKYRPIIGRIRRACGEYIQDPDDQRATLYSRKEELISLVDRGCERKYGLFITAAVAYIASERASAGIFADMAVFLIGSGSSPLSMARYCDQREARLIRLVAPWVSKRWRWAKPFNPEQIDRMVETLITALVEYFPSESHEGRFKEYVLSRFDIDLDAPAKASA